MTAAATASGRSLVVIGASGFVGRHLRRAAVDAGHRVTSVSRTPTELIPGESAVVGGFDRANALIDALPRDSAVVNLAYDTRGDERDNLALADALVDVCRGVGAERVVHVSTAMVAGVVRAPWVTEATRCQPVTPYQRTKLAIEHRLRERLRDVCPLVVLRPTAVFGPGGQNLKKLASDLATRPWYVNYARACLFARRPMNLVPVETVAAAALFAATSPKSAGHDVYFVADDESPANNFRDVETRMREALGLPGYPLPPVPLPVHALALALKAAGRLSADPRTRFSSARLIEAGFERPIAFETALAAYAAAAGAASRSGSAA